MVSKTAIDTGVGSNQRCFSPHNISKIIIMATAAVVIYFTLLVVLEVKGITDLVTWQMNVPPANYDRALLTIAMLLCNYNVHHISIQMWLLVRTNLLPSY